MLGRRSVGRRQQLVLLITAVTIALSVIAMHQMAVNHSVTASMARQPYVTEHGAVVIGVQRDAQTHRLAAEPGGPRLEVGAGAVNSLDRLRR